MFDVKEWVQACLYLLDSDNVNSNTSALHFEFLFAISATCFCVQKWGKN